MNEVKCFQIPAYHHLTINDFLTPAHTRYTRADHQSRQVATGWTIIPISIWHDFSISTLANLLAGYYNVHFEFIQDADGVYHLLFRISSSDSVVCADFIKDNFNDTATIAGIVAIVIIRAIAWLMHHFLKFLLYIFALILSFTLLIVDASYTLAKKLINHD